MRLNVQKIVGYTLLVSCILLPSALKAQTDTLNSLIERIVEFYIESNDLTEFDNNTAFEQLYDLAQNKININTADANKLDELFFLNPLARQEIIRHRNEFGDFVMLEELQIVPSLTLEDIRSMSPFISIGNVNTYNTRDVLEAGKNQMFIKTRRTLQDKAGYLPNRDSVIRYAGDPNYAYIRYRFDSGRKMKLGFTAEKDAGETFFRGNNKNGFDFYSAYAYFENIHPKIKQLALGDYTVNFGQGLIINNGFGYGKSAFVTGIKRGGNPIRQYSSVNEFMYFRGAAATIAASKNLNLTLVFSRKRIDGLTAVDTIEEDEVRTFTSLISTGLHRTESEIAKENSIVQTNIATKLSYTLPMGTINLNGIQYRFDKLLEIDDAPYRKYRFNGNQLQNASLDFDFYHRNFNIFGESAISDNGGRATLVSMLVSLDRRLDLAISYRDYGKTYQAIEPNAFGETSQINDEQGIYFGLEARLTDRLKFVAYADMWKHEWYKFRINGPSNGFDFFSRVEYNIKRKFNTYVQYRTETKQRNITFPNEKSPSLSNITLHRLRWNISHKADKSLEVRGRLEYSFFNQINNDQSGILAFTDVIYKPIAKPYSFSVRYALFDVSGFDARIYTFENDLQYEFSIPFFQNRGNRFYAMSKWRLRRGLAFEVRYSTTKYLDVNEIGSGTEAISGNRRSDIKAQLRISF